MTRSVEIPDAAVEAAAAGVWTEVFNGESPWSEAEPSEREDCLRVTRAALVAARPYLMPTRAEIQDALRGASILEAAGDEDVLTLHESGRIADIILALLNGES